MVPRGLELRTLRLVAVRSNQLSYETIEEDIETHTINQVFASWALTTQYNRNCSTRVIRAGFGLQMLQLSSFANSFDMSTSASAQAWTHWDLNPGPAACEVDVAAFYFSKQVTRQTE